ncbi:MAG: hypothetical protein H8E97_02310 [Bacteroidetes bacterium]|nr:hypothetical protein [Bacteroidota bacterium]
MKVLPIFSVLLAAGAAWFYLFGSTSEGGEVESPTEYASDFWDVWERWESEDEAVLYRFSIPNKEVFHIAHKNNITSVEGYSGGEMEIKPYRGGYLVGTLSSLEKWVDDPGEMSEKWTVSSDKYLALENLRDGRFKLLAGKNKIVVWINSFDEPEIIDGFSASLLDDRTVYTRIEVDEVDEEVEEVVNPVSRVIAHDILGLTRNHRNGSDLDIVWNVDLNAVQAIGSGGEVVWSKILEEGLEPIGMSFEVDLYGNNKYQTAFAVASAIFLVDILGNNVKGFPYQENGITSFAVFDYDHNDKFRFLVANDAGRLYNLRGEGENTPGWNFKVLRNGVSIQQLSHLRVGQSDYIYAGCSDGSVRLLSRNGQLRGSTSVRVNPTFTPAMRLSSTIGKTAVLFIDEQGWVQELTFADAKHVGMSGLAQADKVSLIDMDGDGVEEVVTELNGVRSVYNSRNEKIN